MDTDSKAVMMGWEMPLMEAHARAVCTNGGRILNVGFGMGLVDEAIERYNPEEHTIIEAHPDVYARMLKSGWGEKKHVKIVFGRWQDVLPQLDTYDGTINSSFFSLLLCFFNAMLVVFGCWQDVLPQLDTYDACIFNAMLCFLNVIIFEKNKTELELVELPVSN